MVIFFGTFTYVSLVLKQYFQIFQTQGVYGLQWMFQEATIFLLWVVYALPSFQLISSGMGKTYRLPAAHCLL